MKEIKRYIYLPVFKGIFSFTSFILSIRNNKTLVRRKLVIGALIIALLGLTQGCARKSKPQKTCYRFMMIEKNESTAMADNKK